MNLPMYVFRNLTRLAAIVLSQDERDYELANVCAEFSYMTICLTSGLCLNTDIDLNSNACFSFCCKQPIKMTMVLINSSIPYDRKVGGRKQKNQ